MPSYAFFALGLACTGLALLFALAHQALRSFSRNRLGEPSPEMDYLGQLDAAQLAGFGFGQVAVPAGRGRRAPRKNELVWQPDPKELSRWRRERVSIRELVQWFLAHMRIRFHY